MQLDLFARDAYAGERPTPMSLHPDHSKFIFLEFWGWEEYRMIVYCAVYGHLSCGVFFECQN